MHEVMDWINKEVERLEREMKGYDVDTELEPVPEALKAALCDCIGF